jgi:hypothetical protein
MMVAKSSANENKVFAMNLRTPRPKSREIGRGARKVHQSGRGGVFCVSLVSTVTLPLFCFFHYLKNIKARKVSAVSCPHNVEANSK